MEGGLLCLQLQTISRTYIGQPAETVLTIYLKLDELMRLVAKGQF